MPYIANTSADREAMLKVIGVENIDELWQQAMVTEPVPALDFLPPGKSEIEVTRILSGLASLNRPDLVCFAGGGYYDHFIPAAISHIVERGEFLTSYTPYQAEASQGTLQAIYEYQSAICRLTGMEVSNASLYDGGTALFEAILMALRKGGRKKILVAGSLSPVYRRMIECSSGHLDAEIVFTADGEGPQVAGEIQRHLDTETAGVVVQYPDFFGGLHDWSDLVRKVKERGATAICSCYPMALSLLKPPAEMGFDIATGEGQSLGNPLSFGGPYLGFMATTGNFMRKMPGRVCGRTVDRAGTVGYVLTLQAREQHIRREKATSNICTNESLLALRAVLYLSLLGKSGFRKTGELCTSKAVYARNRILKIPGVAPAGDRGFFNEFVVELPLDAGHVVSRMIKKGYVAGVPLGLYFPHRKRQLLVAVTEMRTREQIEGLAAAMEDVL